MNKLAKLIAFILALGAAPALAAGPVTLRPAISAEGRVTLGDLFEGAGSASGVLAGPAVGASGSVVLDAGQVQRLAAANGLTWANETGLRRIIVRGGGAAPASAATPSGAPARGVEVLTWARNINSGEIVQPEDLTWSVVPSAPSNAAGDADGLIGKSARRPLRSGAVASDRDVTAPLVIARDDMVTVVFASNGVRLELQARAAESAALGETFDAVNLASRKTIQVVAAGPGRALVGPEADALRAMALTNPSRLALR